MAQVQFIAAGTGVAQLNVTSLSVAYPTGIQAGDILLINIHSRTTDGTNTQHTLTGWSGFSIGYSYPGGISAQGTYFSRIATGSETGSIAVTIVGNNANKLHVARMYSFRNARQAQYFGYTQPIWNIFWQFTSPLPPEVLVDTNANVSNTVIFGDVWSPQDEALGICLVNVWDDNPQTAPTGSVGGTWTEAVPEFTTTVGTDASVGLFTVPLSADQIVSGGSFSMGGGGASDPWFLAHATFLANDPMPSFTPSNSFNQMGFYGV
jgi:hypothetical protein